MAPAAGSAGRNYLYETCVPNPPLPFPRAYPTRPPAPSPPPPPIPCSHAPPNAYLGPNPRLPVFTPHLVPIPSPPTLPPPPYPLRQLHTRHQSQPVIPNPKPTKRRPQPQLLLPHPRPILTSIPIPTPAYDARYDRGVWYTPSWLNYSLDDGAP